MATEKRLIDANALFPGRILAVNIKDPMKTVDYLMNKIINAPTVDAVEAVRCKDCKHWEEAYGTDGKLGYCSCLSNQHGSLTIWYPEDFCSYGERKDNGK